jgi:hypothetical protein
MQTKNAKSKRRFNDTTFNQSSRAPTRNNDQCGELQPGTWESRPRSVRTPDSPVPRETRGDAANKILDRAVSAQGHNFNTVYSVHFRFCTCTTVCTARLAARRPGRPDSAPVQNTNVRGISSHVSRHVNISTLLITLNITSGYGLCDLYLCLEAEPPELHHDPRYCTCNYIVNFTQFAVYQYIHTRHSTAHHATPNARDHCVHCAGFTFPREC